MSTQANGKTGEHEWTFLAYDPSWGYCSLRPIRNSGPLCHIAGVAGPCSFSDQVRV